MTTTTDTAAQEKALMEPEFINSFLEALKRDSEELKGDKDRFRQSLGYTQHFAATIIEQLRSRAEAAEARVKELTGEASAWEGTALALRDRVKELETAINQTIGWQESTDPMNAESVRLLVNVMQQKDGG